MVLTQKNYNFQGPFHSDEQLKNILRIYLVFCTINEYSLLLAIGAAEKIREYLKKSRTCNDWNKYSSGIITYNVCYTPELQPRKRLSIVKEITDYLEEKQNIK